MRIYDLAFVCRSKNAGPFQLTVDLMFRTAGEFGRVLGAANFTGEAIGALYGADSARVQIKPFPRILTIKVVIPRRCGSGGPGDTDVYGSQQHFPLGAMEIA